jgi:hypothetical protein
MSSRRRMTSPNPRPGSTTSSATTPREFPAAGYVTDQDVITATGGAG